MNITPEILSVVAVGMGYKVTHQVNGDLIVIKPTGGACIYAPHTNPEQRMEITDKLVEKWITNTEKILGKAVKAMEQASINGFMGDSYYEVINEMKALNSTGEDSE